MKTRSSDGRCQRLLRLVALFQRGGTLTVGQIAELTGVSLRTVYRDLKLLQSAGIKLDRPPMPDRHTPIWPRLPRRGYRLAGHDETTVVPQLEPDELSMLALAARRSWLTQLPAGRRLAAAALNKLLAAAPSAVGASVDRLLASVSWTFEFQAPDRRDRDIFGSVVRAIQQGRRVHIVAEEPSTRRVHTTLVSPHRIEVGPGGWRLVGSSSQHRRIVWIDPRHIRAATLSDQRYLLPRRARHHRNDGQIQRADDSSADSA